MFGGFAVVHLGEGACFDGHLCESEFGFGDGCVKYGYGGPCGRSEHEAVGVGGGFVVSLK